MCGMRNEALGDVIKVWLYAAASVWLGAWISPLLYNAGKALAEVSSGRVTNGFFEWLAAWCVSAEFPDFFRAGLLVAALALFFPWMEWVHARRGIAAAGGPWRVRLPDGARVAGRGQVLEKNPQALWQGGAGFLLAAGLLLPLGIALVPAGMATLRDPGSGLPLLVLRSLVTACALAAVMELCFRGIAMGIFLRGMRPAVALGMSAVFFALVLYVIPPAGMRMAGAEEPGMGFELLRLMATRFSDGAVVLSEFAPLLALGAVLGYARWRTASLWLPAGLHAGWWFARDLLVKLGGTPNEALHSGSVLLYGVVPLVAILIAGLLAHFLTANPPPAHAAES